MLSWALFTCCLRGSSNLEINKRQSLKLNFQENMKITMKPTKIKEKICETCGLQNSCGDLPGFCLLIYYVPVGIVVVGLLYLLVTMPL